MKNILYTTLLLITMTLSAQESYLQCGTIIDTGSGKQLKEKTIVVSGNIIKRIENGYIAGGEKDTIIDLKNKIVLPGFIDLHVHIEGESSP
jgi:adenine deaminase